MKEVANEVVTNVTEHKYYFRFWRKEEISMRNEVEKVLKQYHIRAVEILDAGDMYVYDSVDENTISELVTSTKWLVSYSIKINRPDYKYGVNRSVAPMTEAQFIDYLYCLAHMNVIADFMKK